MKVQNDENSHHEMENSGRCGRAVRRAQVWTTDNEEYARSDVSSRVSSLSTPAPQGNRWAQLSCPGVRPIYFKITVEHATAACSVYTGCTRVECQSSGLMHPWQAAFTLNPNLQISEIQLQILQISLQCIQLQISTIVLRLYAKELKLSAVNCRYLKMWILQLIRDVCNLFQISAFLWEISLN